jgi:hypothetical protein
MQRVYRSREFCWTAFSYAAVGIMRAFRHSQVYGVKIFSPILGVVALLSCSFFI